MSLSVKDITKRRPSDYTPGAIFMHSEQFNKLHTLMVERTTRLGGGPTHVETTWNGVPVRLDDSLPRGGWYLVPGSVV